MQANFFPGASAFRKWLEKNHQNEKEIIVGYYKVATGKPSMTWSESVDQALCFGWIDGIRRSIDGESYCIRFTPRRPGSTWSAVNIAKAEELIRKGLMKPAGLLLYKIRKEEKSELYSYENRPAKLPSQFESKFRANKESWNFFTSQPPSYQKTRIFWIMSARQEATKLARLEKLMAACIQGKRLF